MKIKKGDEVKLVSGKDKGKTGKVTKVFPSSNSAIVDGLNMFKKHLRPKQAGKKGEIVSVSKPVNFSALRLVCSGCNKVTRAGYVVESGKKTRICKKCGKTI